MAYTVLARRYRSQTFDDVLGQDVVARTLRNAIATGRVAHAYLFCGTRGCGKTTMARILAKSLNCLAADGPTVKPCLKCDSCININTGEDIDVLEIDGASNTGVDNIRQLRENAIYRPARARFKIYIIDEVHMLSSGAFNALLKILEEPPEHVKFIFATTEPNKVLPTIQSRCQRFDFHNIPPEVISEQIRRILGDEGIAFEPDLLVHLSRLANGSMRDALSLLDQLISAGTPPLNARQLIDLVGIPDRQKVAQLLTAIAEHDGAGVLEKLDQMLLTGQNTGQICEAMIDVMRDVMIYLSAGKESKLLTLTEEERDAVGALSEKFDIAGLVYHITALEKLQWTLKNSESSRALLEALLLRLTLSEHFIGLDRLADHLRTLPAGAGEVKKKSLTASDNHPAAQMTAPPQPGNAVVAKADSGDLQNAFIECDNAAGDGGPMEAEAICQQWPRIAAEVGRSVGGGLATMLPFTQAFADASQTLHLTFPSNGAGAMTRKICEDRKVAIEKILSSMAGRPLRITFETPGDTRPTQEQQSCRSAVQADESPASTSVPAETLARPTREERNAVLNDPQVKMVLLGLNARLIDIQKIEPEEPPDDMPPEPDEVLE
jgi:DNA polymerase-3 subunit gamma/tau